MNRTRLVQRLNAPSKTTGGLGDNPFAFGGGLRNGGLSETAMDLLRPVFSFDYMGAAEYEFGAVQQTLAAIKASAIAGNLVTFEVKGLKKPVWGLAPKEIVAEASELVRELAKKQYDRQLKESSLFYDALNPDKITWPVPTLGWLELNNHFFWTVDQKMYDGFANLMGVQHEQ